MFWCKNNEVTTGSEKISSLLEFLERQACTKPDYEEWNK
jgi:hypothetical protein